MGFQKSFEAKIAENQKLINNLQTKIEAIETIAFENNYYKLESHIDDLNQLREQLDMSNRMGYSLK